MPLQQAPAAVPFGHGQDHAGEPGP
jgi:hypothetical protein